MTELLGFDFAAALDSFARLAIAFVLSLPVALEREKEDKPLGLRTFPLVAIASTAYVMVGKIAFPGDAGAQARIIQGLITGIGFVGAGAIIKEGMDISGTATAASIWATAALGAAVAYNRFEIAVVLALTNFLVLRSLEPVSKGISDRVERLDGKVEEMVEKKLEE
ncbi:MAG: MgtC/SapB family protein [Thermoanaerobaculia bacterium]|nr:MgtC/SapB family protein [Thermoanaerobaculia bacterium]